MNFLRKNYSVIVLLLSIGALVSWFLPFLSVDIRHSAYMFYARIKGTMLFQQYRPDTPMKILIFVTKLISSKEIYGIIFFWFNVLSVAIFAYAVKKPWTGYKYITIVNLFFVIYVLYNLNSYRQMFHNAVPLIGFYFYILFSVLLVVTSLICEKISKHEIKN